METKAGHAIIRKQYIIF